MQTAHRLTIASFCLFFLFAGTSAQAGWVQKQVFPKVSLRGYGNVSGTLFSSGRSSILEISCDSADKAKLTQAKYLSDIQLLPGTSKLAIGGTVSAIAADGQGLLSALRFGDKVVILASPTQPELERLVAQASEKFGDSFDSAPGISVPMWLDRFDKYGYRFYYHIWDGSGNPLTYDFTKDFDFAAKFGIGMLFWDIEPHVLDADDTAEGIRPTAMLDWSIREASLHNLPIAATYNGPQTGSGYGWYRNRFQDETDHKAPEFCGNWHFAPDWGSYRVPPWLPSPGTNLLYSYNAAYLKDWAAMPNVISVQEMHAELRHGPHDIFMEYGPMADKSYRQYLKAQYKTLAAVNERWGTQAASWDAVRVPEAAEFLGWGPCALDLAGKWRIFYEQLAPEFADKASDYNWLRENSPETVAPPAEYYSEKFDDSSWPEVTAPGSDITNFLFERPAIYRRTIEVPKGWLADKSRVWLYVWDLDRTNWFEWRKGLNCNVALNGKMIAESPLLRIVPHWQAVEVTGLLREGSNQLTLRLPKGIICYRVYLSPDEPKPYPELGEKRNAQWVDFTDWIQWTRLEAVRHGSEVIREADPDWQIDYMAPGFYMDGIKEIARAFGGNFKDTGGMGTSPQDYLPSVMRGTGLPFTAETGESVHNVDDFKLQMAHYFFNGVNGVDHAHHMNVFMSDKQVEAEFERTLPMLKLFGKFHCPTAEVAALYSTNVNALAGYPWVQDMNLNLSPLASGAFAWNVRAYLTQLYESDGLTESSFQDGDASRYRVILDTNSSIMDDAMVSRIEKYVRDGGMFMTYAQTGRHTPTMPDAWPISRLTGYKVTHIDKMDTLGNGGRPLQARHIQPAPGQDVFSGDWSSVIANGLTLKKVAPDAKDLMLWQDGSTAIGLRKLGKGYIIQVGCKFSGPIISLGSDKGSSAGGLALRRLLTQLLQWRGIAPAEGVVSPEIAPVYTRHFVANNGLYDIWFIWNSGKVPVTANYVLPPAKWIMDVETGKKIDADQNTLHVSLDPEQYHVYLTPRPDFAEGPVEWFNLQRGWWQGTTPPETRTPPPPPSKDSFNLTNGWAFKPLDAGADGTSLSGTDVNDSSWEKISIGIWTPDHPDVKHAILRKTFSVPARWHGTPGLWLTYWAHPPDILDKGRIWLDGKLISDWSEKGLDNANPDGVLKPGTTHTLAIEIAGDGPLIGSRGNVWLWCWPTPLLTQDLAGQWDSSPDILHYGTAVQLPGKCFIMSARRSVVIPKAESGNNVVVNVEGEGPLRGVLINGTWITRFHHTLDQRFQLNITPWVRFGQDNEIELLVTGQDGPLGKPYKVTVRNISLEFFKKGVYP